MISVDEYTRRIKAHILNRGADLVGVAELVPFRDSKVHPANLLDGFERVVSIAIQLPVATFEPITERPTPIYMATYQTANRILDELAYKTAIDLQRDGYRSLPVPASQVVDKDRWQGAISHKAVARMAGLGWQGKNLLLITPQYGSRIRLVSILTRAPLAADAPMKNRCGRCTACQDACPARAIRGVNTKDRYETRNDAMFFSRCVEKLTGEFASLPGIESPICGICINACPFGKKVSQRTTQKKMNGNQ